MRGILSTVFAFLVYQQQIHAQDLPRCRCNRADRSPVCGTDNRDYFNMCALDCANEFDSYVDIDYDGPCLRNRPNPCVCPKIYKPVCGSDGRNYGSPCQLLCAQNDNPGLSVLDFGVCPSYRANSRQSTQSRACFCTYEYNPVCGSDGKTYGNPCILKCADRESPFGISIQRFGECPVIEMNNRQSSQFLPCQVTMEYMPICGSDGKTYSNQSEMNCANRDSPFPITFAYRGPCKNK